MDLADMPRVLGGQLFDYTFWKQVMMAMALSATDRVSGLDRVQNG